MNDRIKVLIDTDIGDDIDDTFALLLAMHLNFDIVGITTVFQNTVSRARLAKKILKSFGSGYEQVPVYAGYGTPIDTRREEYPMCQYSPDLECNEYQPDGTDPDQAVDFIIDCCKKYGEQLCILAIGPFTNIARAIEKNPSIFNGIKRFVIMGGAYYKQYADWNVICDVPAADIMFKNITNLEAVGADVTHRLPLSDAERQIILDYNGNSNCARIISHLYDSWWASRISGRTALHDPLAVYYLFDSAICETEKQSIAVMTDGLARGMTLNIDAYGKSQYNPYCTNLDLSKKATVAKEVQAQKFIDIFMSCFKF